MSSLLDKIEAMEKVGAGNLADQAIQKLIHLHLQKYERQMEGVQRDLEPFERRYGMKSEECYRRFSAGELGDAADIVEWMGLYDNVLLYRDRIETLRTVTGA